MKKNFVLNTVYQFFILIIPLIISPYLSRVIGAAGIGIYSYTYSIIYYFMLFTLLGINNYGNRQIAKVRDDKNKVSKNFFEIYTMQLICGLIMLIFYLLFTFFLGDEYANYYLLGLFFVLSAIFDINWFFFGIEEFKKTVSRNVFVKILTLILIFIFVRNENDVWKYMLIMSLSTMFGQAMMWFFLPKYVNKCKIKLKDVKKHIKPNLILFIPIIAISLYKFMDKIMLGQLSNIIEVGYYENAEKIINVPLLLASSLGTVMLPRITNLALKDNRKAVLYVNKAINFMTCCSFPMMFGLIAVSKDFVILYYGTDFLKSALLINLLALTIPAVNVSYILKTGYCIPFEHDKIYIKSIILGALINFAFNLYFIPKFSSVGACIGTILAEYTVLFVQLNMYRKNNDIKPIVENMFRFLIFSIIMFIIVSLIGLINFSHLVGLFIKLIVGMLIYFWLARKYIFYELKVANSLNGLKSKFTSSMGKIKKRLLKAKRKKRKGDFS